MKNPLIKCLLYSILFIFFSELMFKILNVRMLIYSNVSEQLTPEQFNNYIDIQNQWQWIGYIIMPLLMIIKTVLITSTVYIGIIFFYNNTISFKQLWNIIVNSEIIFLVLPICKIIWFFFFQTNYTLEDIQYFYPLSALNIFDYKVLAPWLIYPLQTLNVFELAYIIILSYQIGAVTKTNADRGLKIVGSSYIPALLLWVTIVMFFTLNFS